MGYYITLTEADAVLPLSQLDEAYRRMCELNTTHHAQKNGGRFGGPPADPPGSDKWFSWMDWNYPETCACATEILDRLGFEIEFESGGVALHGYGSKTGQEGLFIKAIADLFPSGSYMNWRGEHGEQWRWLLGPEGFREQEARIVWEDF